jgi:hypothetical protein
MIDNPLEVALLMAKLEAALPLSATTPQPCWPRCNSRRRAVISHLAVRSPRSTIWAMKAATCANLDFGTEDSSEVALSPSPPGAASAACSSPRPTRSSSASTSPTLACEQHRGDQLGSVLVH